MLSCWTSLQVVKQNVLGTVVGQSATDPGGRVTVAFARREDGRSNNLTLKPKTYINPPGLREGVWVVGMSVSFLWVAMVENGGSFNTWELQVAIAIGICEGELKGENFIEGVLGRSGGHVPWDIFYIIKKAIAGVAYCTYLQLILFKGW